MKTLLWSLVMVLVSAAHAGDKPSPQEMEQFSLVVNKTVAELDADCPHETPLSHLNLKTNAHIVQTSTDRPLKAVEVLLKLARLPQIASVDMVEERLKVNPKAAEKIAQNIRQAANQGGVSSDPNPCSLRILESLNLEPAKPQDLPSKASLSSEISGEKILPYISPVTGE